jgi:hypothetical protein
MSRVPNPERESLEDESCHVELPRKFSTTLSIPTDENIADRRGDFEKKDRRHDVDEGSAEVTNDLAGRPGAEKALKSYVLVQQSRATRMGLANSRADCAHGKLSRFQGGRTMRC